MRFEQNSLYIEGIRYIEPKAYLGNRRIKEIIISDEVEEIGQWAFAHMKFLHRVKVPERSLSLGKEIFLGCDCLKEIIVVRGDGSENVSDAILLGCVIRLLGAQVLFTPETVGQASWYEQWDKVVITFLQTEDSEKFSPVFFGGEEDYCKDEATDLELYCKMIRRKKLTLCFERLKQPQCLTEERRRQYKTYIEACCRENRSELGMFLAEESTQDMRVLQLFLEEGCGDADFDTWWMAHQDKFCPEALAMLIQRGSGPKEITDYFSL